MGAVASGRTKTAVAENKRRLRPVSFYLLPFFFTGRYDPSLVCVTLHFDAIYQESRAIVSVREIYPERNDILLAVPFPPISFALLKKKKSRAKQLSLL
jgi:hypothetical protein